MKQESVSIIITVYNVQEYVEQCLESLINQTYSQIEMIVVDDGSSDESLDICYNLAKKDSRINVITQENSGVSAARNRGIEFAQGKYMLFVDADDYVKENYVECLVNALEESPSAQIAVCGYNRIKQGQITNAYVIDHEMNIEELYRRIFAENTILSGCWNKIFITEVVKNNKLQFDTSLHVGEDMLFVAKYLILVDNHYTYIPIALYYYRYNSKSALKSVQFNMKKATCLDAVRKLQELCYKNGLADTYIDYCFSYRVVRSSLWLLYQMIISKCYDRKSGRNIQNNIRHNFRKYKKYHMGSRVEKIAVRIVGIAPHGVYCIGRVLLRVAPEKFKRYIS